MIACICMLIDHINTFLSFEIFHATGINIAYVNILPFSFAWLYAIGRIAFSIFCFQFAEGCRYTSNIRKYFLRLFLFGIITQPVYAWAHEFDHSGNVMFTFTLGVLYKNILSQKLVLLLLSHPSFDTLYHSLGDCIICIKETLQGSKK